PVYLNRLMKARNTGREPSIGSRPEDDGPLGQLVWSIHFLRRKPRNDVDFRPKIEATPISFPELAVFRVERYSRVGIQYRRALPSPEESWTEHVQHQFQ
ncbi:MAG: hypothetical protein WBX00_24440, partial [Isosphaeraceae bacterium]